MTKNFWSTLIAFVNKKSLAVCNTIPSAYTLYGHLEQYCTNPLKQKMDEMSEFVRDGIENMGKETKCWITTFYLFSTMFSNALCSRVDKSCNCLDYPFPNKPWFLCVCYESLLKTLQEKKKFLVTSNFSFSLFVFYPFKKLSAIFIKICGL